MTPQEIGEKCLAERHAMHDGICGPCETQIYYLTHDRPVIDLAARRAAKIAEKRTR